MIYTVSNNDLESIALNETDEIQQILQNVAVLLNTWRGEVPLHRDFGIDPDVLHKPINMVEDALMADVIETVEKYEPRAHVEEVEAEYSESEPDKIVITVTLEIDVEAGYPEVKEVVS